MPPAGTNPPPSASSSNSAPVNIPTTQASSSNTTTIGAGMFPQMPFGSFPMVLPPFGK